MLATPSVRRLALLTFVVLVFRLGSVLIVSSPGYTDSYYFAGVAARLAHGDGLSADFIWSPLEADEFVFPVPSHLFWVPMATVLGGLGIVLAGPVVGDFRAAQAMIVLVSLLIPAVAYAAARALGCDERWALVAGFCAGIGGLFAPAFAAVDAFAPAAVLGTLFFLAFRRAAQGSVPYGITAGVLVGALYLSRSEAALFGVALIALVPSARSRGAGLGGAATALAIGLAWVARDISLGVGQDLFARSTLLGRYEDFFAFVPAYTTVSPIDSLLLRAGAMATNALTFAFAFAIVLTVPIVAGLRALRASAAVRAWFGLLVIVFLAQSLLWTLHSTRGSYFHSLAAFFPFGVAIAACGARTLLASRERGVQLIWAGGVAILVVVISVSATLQWDVSFGTTARVRAGAVAAIPMGPFLAIDAAAWHWLSGREVAVTPADGLAMAACVARRIGARSLVLESAHFSRYESLYGRDERPDWLAPAIVVGTTKIYAVASTPPCAQ